MSTENKTVTLRPDELDVASIFTGLGYRVEARGYSPWEKVVRLMQNPGQELERLLFERIKPPRGRSRILRAVLVTLT